MLWTRRTIAADPAAAWALLTDTDRWAEWGPTVRGGELDPPGRFEAGATGHVRTIARVALPFELTEVVPERRWAWKVAGIPATAHAVEPVDGGVEVGFGVPAPAAPYLAVCLVALHRIDSLLTDG